MEINIKEENKNGMDRLLVALSLLGLLLCAIPLVSDSAYSWLFGKSDAASTLPPLGEITYAKNDIRHKHFDFIVWDKARDSQTIHLGDSVFTGEKSQSQVRLKDGNHVDLDENSMVTFAHLDNLEIPNLALGNFRVTVQGKMKIAIDGVLNELEGEGSEIQVIVKDREKPQLKLLKGTAKVRTKNHKALELALHKSVFTEPVQTSPPPAVTRPEIKAHSFPRVIVHTQHLYDLFEILNGNLFIRKQPRTFGPLNPALPPISWTVTGNARKVFAQLSHFADFRSIGDSWVVDASLKQSVFKNAYLGPNFFRLSVDGENWNETQAFEVKAKPLPGKAPDLLIHPRHAYILHDSVNISLKPTGGGSVENFVLEISPEENFPAQATKVFWADPKGVSLTLTNPQTLFARIRGVDSSGQLTEVSPLAQLEIEKPLLPEVPRLAKNNFKIFEQDSLELNWQQSNGSIAVEVLNESGQKIKSLVVTGSRVTFTDLTTGKFQFRLQGLDKFKRKSKEFAIAQVQVVKQPTPLLALTGKQNLKRTPSTEEPPSGSPFESSKLKLENTIPDYLNRNYPQSKISLEGAGFTVFSQEQAAQGKSNPTALTFSLRTLNWLGFHGFEGALKTKVAGLKSSPGTEVSPLQVEARYRYRFFLPLNPFSGLKSSEFSLMLGYEYYRNATSGASFSPGYNLLKAGLGLNFPLLSRWSSGGEVFYGFSEDGNKKYEISGFLDYFMKRDLSLGVGYRVHLFEAGSTASSPLGLPYREGFGEGYSALKWSY